nr:MAG TPA: hypothetical protein [Bacteriophage sp.]
MLVSCIFSSQLYSILIDTVLTICIGFEPITFAVLYKTSRILYKFQLF